MSDLARLDGSSQPLPYIPGTKSHPPQRLTPPFLPNFKPLIRLLLDKNRPPLSHPYRYYRSRRPIRSTRQAADQRARALASPDTPAPVYPLHHAPIYTSLHPPLQHPPIHQAPLNQPPLLQPPLQQPPLRQTPLQQPNPQARSLQQLPLRHPPVPQPVRGTALRSVQGIAEPPATSLPHSPFPLGHHAPVDASQPTRRTYPRSPRPPTRPQLDTPGPAPFRKFLPAQKHFSRAQPTMPPMMPTSQRTDMPIADREALQEALRQHERASNDEVARQRRRDERRRERGCEVHSNRRSRFYEDDIIGHVEHDAHWRREQSQADPPITVPQQAYTKPPATRGMRASMYETRDIHHPAADDHGHYRSSSEVEVSCMPYWAESIYHAMYGLAMNVGSLIGTFAAAILTFLLGIVHCIITGVLVVLAAVVDGLTTMLRIFFNIVTCHWSSGDWSWEWRHLTHVWNWGRKSKWVFDFVTHVSPPQESDHDARIAKRNSIHEARKEEYKREQAEKGNYDGYGGHGGLQGRRHGTYALGPDEMEKGIRVNAIA